MLSKCTLIFTLYTTLYASFKTCGKPQFNLLQTEHYIIWEKILKPDDHNSRRKFKQSFTEDRLISPGIENTTETATATTLCCKTSYDDENKIYPQSK